MLASDQPIWLWMKWMLYHDPPLISLVIGLKQNKSAITGSRGFFFYMQRVSSLVVMLHSLGFVHQNSQQIGFLPIIENWMESGLWLIGWGNKLTFSWSKFSVFFLHVPIFSSLPQITSRCLCYCGSVICTILPIITIMSVVFNLLVATMDIIINCELSVIQLVCVVFMSYWKSTKRLHY